MSNLAVNYASGGLAPLFEKGKGTINNRLENCGQNILNNVKTGAAAVATIGTAGGLTYAAYKYAPVCNALTNAFKFIQKNMGKNKITASIAKVVTKVLEDIPRSGKVGIILGAIALPIVAFTTANGIYKAGQIDQKYTDKATLYDSKGVMI